MPLQTANKFMVTNLQKNFVPQAEVKTVVQPSESVKAAVITEPAKASFAFHNVMLNSSVAKKVFTPILSIPITINPPIPDASTKNGNLFNDRFDKNILWYLPTFNLIPGVDKDFSFIAKQSTLPNDSGDPFYIASVKLNLQKAMPSDAVNAKAANASVTLKEISLDSLQVSLSLACNDAQGNEIHPAYTGTIQVKGDGNYELNITNIKGNQVVILYENLKITGSVQISLSASYTAWRSGGAPILFLNKNFLLANSIKPQGFSNIKLVQFKNFNGRQQPKPVNGFNENEAFYQVVDLQKNYAANDYQLCYKLSSDTGTRPIIDVNDLKNLNGNPTEFSELKTIDLRKYPSVNSLYIGVLSRVIIVLPRAYGIVRNAAICSAECIALVDSTPSGASSCKFQFQFELTPDVDPVEFMLLLKEVQQNSELQDYTLKFADSLSDKSRSDLSSAFSEDTSYDSSATPQNFLLTTMIIDKPGQSAVAGANLFIQQLCHVPPGCVIGTLQLKLDDNFPNEVKSLVTLSLPNAISDDGIGWSVDTDTQTVTLTNTTSFDFILNRYMFCSDEGIGDPLTVNIPISAGGSTNISLPKTFTHLSIVLDYTENSSGAVDRTNIARYMEIKTQDVQNVSYFIGVNSTQIKYSDHGIRQIDAQVILNTLSSVNVPQFSMMNQNTDGSTKVLLPLQFAVSSLPATIDFTIEFTDATKQPFSFTRQNDFIQNPVFDLTDADVVQP